MRAARLPLWQSIRRTKVSRPNTNKTSLKRVNWEQIEARPVKEGRGVVKGTSKRVVVVKSPDPKIFEQAIFIVREDFLTRKGGRDMDILREAQKVADEYIKNSVANHEAIWSRIPSALYLVIGLLVSAGIWAAIFFLGM